jgi:hypothetical protein
MQTKLQNSFNFFIKETTSEETKTFLIPATRTIKGWR